MEISLKSLSKCLGISERTIQKLTDQNIMVRVNRGVYDLEKSIKNYVDYEINKAANKPYKLTLKEVQVQHEQLKMRKTKIEVEAMESQLYRAEDVKIFWNVMSGAVRNRFNQIPQNVSDKVAGLENTAQIQQIIMKEVKDALNEASNYNLIDFVDPSLFEDDDDVC